MTTFMSTMALRVQAGFWGHIAHRETPSSTPLVPI